MHQDRKEAKLSQWLAAARRSVISNSEGWHSPENEGDPAGEGSYVRIIIYQSVAQTYHWLVS